MRLTLVTMKGRDKEERTWIISQTIYLDPTMKANEMPIKTYSS